MCVCMFATLSIVYHHYHWESKSDTRHSTITGPFILLNTVYFEKKKERERSFHCIYVELCIWGIFKKIQHLKR